MAACELLAVELRLDRIDAELAVELPSHMRMFARAYARGAPLPAAPDVLLRAATLATARAALAHPLLADRGVALLRLVAPIAIEADAAVVAARAAPPSWDALAALAAARHAAAVRRLGHGAVDALHHLHGSFGAGIIDGARPALPPPIPAWSVPDGITVDDHAIGRRWHALSARHGVDGVVRFEPAASARPRAFVVQPGAEVIVVIPAHVATPADRFAVLHELGHALAALALPAGIPRVVDEAVAAYVARAIERAGDAWYSAAAGPARLRRSLLARMLDWTERQTERRSERQTEAPTERYAERQTARWIERQAGRQTEAPTGRQTEKHTERQAEDVPPVAADHPAQRPPWALWHDPAAQAAYVVAEALADELERTVGVAPGTLAAALAGHRAAIDHRAATAL